MQRKQRTMFIQILLHFLLMSCDQAHACENKPLILDDNKCERNDESFKEKQCVHMEGGRLSLNTMRVGDGFSEEVIHLEVDFEHNIWILRESKKDPEDWQGTRFLEKHSLNGDLLVQIPQPQNIHFNTFAMAKNRQELILVETRLISGATEGFEPVYHIWFKRFNSNGKLLQEAPLQDSGSEKEFLVYSVTKNSQPIILQRKRPIIDDGVV